MEAECGIWAGCGGRSLELSFLLPKHMTSWSGRLVAVWMVCRILRSDQRVYDLSQVELRLTD